MSPDWITPQEQIAIINGMVMKNDTFICLGDVGSPEYIKDIKARKKILDGVCITGGEPLLHQETLDLLAAIKSLGLAVKLDTNGSFPGRLKNAVNEGLVDMVAMDIKNSKNKYQSTCGGADVLNKVSESVEFLLSGKVDYEFRTTVVKEYHTVEDMEKIAHWISGAPRYFLQNFEDSGNLISDGCSSHNPQMLLVMKNAVSSILPKVDIRGV
jgi:pyruvate formate lyase activating enzyme